MKPITDWIGQNWPGLFAVAIAALLLGFGVWGSGCNVDDYIKVKVPAEVRSMTGAPATIPLSDAEREWAKFTSGVTYAADEFSENIADAAFVSGLLRSFMNVGLESLANSGAMATVPGGGIVIAALMYSGGLITRKPGDGKRLAEADKERVRLEANFAERLRIEKEASYKKGQQTALDITSIAKGKA